MRIMTLLCSAVILSAFASYAVAAEKVEVVNNLVRVVANDTSIVPVDAPLYNSDVIPGFIGIDHAEVELHFDPALITSVHVLGGDPLNINVSIDVGLIAGFKKTIIVIPSDVMSLKEVGVFIVKVRGGAPGL